MVTSRYNFDSYEYDSLKKKYVPENGIWKPNVERDTVIWEYNTVTKETVRIPPEDSNSKGWSRDSIVLISQTPTLKHQREYWPKPSIDKDIYTYTKTDSVIQMYISESGDTVGWQKEFFKKGRRLSLYSFESEMYRNGSSLEVQRFKWNNKFFYKGTTIKTYSEREDADTTFFWGLPWWKIYRKTKFNEEENERYTAGKQIKTPGKATIYETVYNDYWKKYFTTKTVRYYKKGEGISRIVRYDAHGTLEEEIIFYQE